ncbi:hypothetical protein BIW11_12602 [Tropilaelaps mercedesae]|uniref:C2H2-type domain-containing protein n=1 Tax=Tropilaelaps mercedesae TaxID=418985 RepID=A0A1V9X681_9ACAR|nr:hypothetical protein BIW11_12602 [Tropilaelaps mercedesae]
MEDENNGLLTPGWTPREARLVTCCLCNFSSLSQKGVTIHLRKAHNIHLNPPRSKSQKAQRYRRPQSQHLHPPINGSFGRCAPGEVDMRFPPSTQYSLMGQMTSFNQNRHSLLPTQIDIQSLHDKYRDNNKLASFEQQNVTSSLQENTDPSTASLGFLHVNLTPSQSQNTPFSQCNEPHQNNAAFSQDGVPIMYETPDLNQSCDSSFHPTNCPVHDTTASQTNMVQSQYPVMPPLTRLPGLSLQDSSHSSLFENSVGGPWSWYLTQLCVICGYRARNDFDINRHMEADHANVNVYVQPETNNWPSIQESHNCVTETRLRIRPLNSDRVHSPCDRNSIKLEPLDVNLRDSDYLVHRSAEKQDVQRPHFPPSQLQSSSENRWKPARHSGDFTAMGNAEISSITPEFAHSHRTVNMLVDNVRGQRPQIGNLTVDCFAETDSRTTYSSGRLDINQLYNTHLEEKEVTSQQLARLREPPAQSAVAYKANVAPTIQAICEADHRQQHQVFSSNEIRAEINSNIGNSTEFLNCTRPCLGSVQRDPKMIGASAPSLTEAGLTAKSLLSSSGSSHTEVLCVTNKDALTGGDQTTKGGVHCIHFDDEAKRQVEHVNRIVIIDRVID